MSVTPNLEEQVDERQISVPRWCYEFFSMPENFKSNLFHFFKHKTTLDHYRKSENIYISTIYCCVMNYSKI